MESVESSESQQRLAVLLEQLKLDLCPILLGRQWRGYKRDGFDDSVSKLSAIKRAYWNPYKNRFASFWYCEL